MQIYRKKLKALHRKEHLTFDENLHGNLPPRGGIYRIALRRNRRTTLYVGKAKSLRQRLYHNLIMGQNRSHTLKRKLIRDGRCRNRAGTRRYLERNCVFQFIEESDPRERSFLEHYVIAALRPTFND